MTEDSVAALASALDGCRDELQALPGVVGTGVGSSSGGVPAIQIFVRSESDADDVERSAAALLQDMPLEVVVVGDVTAASVEEGENDGES